MRPVSKVYGSSDDEAELSAEDIKKIKQLFNEQEEEINSLEKTLKHLKEEIGS